jgi:uncharacterized protein
VNELLNEARNYLVEFLKGKQLQTETKHPWRKEWEFAVFHSLRVEAYIVKILEREQYNMAEADVILLRLAAILHDIGRMEITSNHAELGAEVAGHWLSSISPEKLTEKQKQKVIEMIADHSEKDQTETDISNAVLKDADTLDEIGVMSIFMSSNWIDRQSPYFFRDLCRRLKEFEIPFCEEKMALLNTNGAREILKEKKAFIESFIIQLNSELEMNNQIEYLP